jgi:hypothetical protein
MARSRNTQMFALSEAPPARLSIAGALYALRRVFKHDFWAATCLYERVEATGNESDPPAKLVVKFGRAQHFAGLPLDWIGTRLADHEQAIYQALTGLPHVPRWVQRISPICYAIEYIDAPPLDHLPTPPDGFFDELREAFQAVHRRGVAYVDSNKRSNILVRDTGRPVLIDFQISLRRRPGWVWPARTILDRVIDYLQQKDLYHLCKHKRRLRPDELTPEEDALSRRRGGLHGLHRKLTKPYRTLRRRFLQTQHEQGKLQSPTAMLEDHHQPEKETWKKP